LKQTSQQSKFRVEHPARKHRQLTVRICVALFLVGFALTTFFMRSSSALGRTFAAEESNTAGSASVLNAEGTLQPSDLVSATPSPEGDTTPLSTETQLDTATPSAGEETTPTPTPDPSATAEQPTEVREVSFQRESDGVQVRVNTQLPLPAEAAPTLSLSRMTAEGDAASYEPYRALLANAVSPEQAQNYIAYELNYAADGNAIVPTQSAADLSLRDKTQQFPADTDSVRVYYLLCGEDNTAQLHSVSAHIEDGALVFSLSSCPRVILVERQTATDATPSPETTPEPSPSASPLPVYEYDCDGLYVSGSPANSEVLPEGAVLSAMRITSENSPERYAKYAEMLQALYNTDFPIAFNAYDISFHADGHEVEPVGDVVNVTIRDASFTQAVEAPLVYHVVDEQGGQPALEAIPATEDTSTGEEQVAFSADSFSVFIVLANGTTITLADGSGLTYKVIATAADTFTNTSYYNSAQKLGIAGNFHIVAFNTATLGAHTNGNVLAKYVSANSNFGTNGLANELSYIQNYTQVNGVSASNNAHVLVLGNTHDTTNVITAVDNGNAFAISGTKLDRPKNLWQDQATATTPFIDLVAVKASSKSLASSLAGKAAAYTESHLSTTGGSCDLSYINLTNPDKVGFYNITASALSGYSYFGVKGFQSGHSGTVIINVDCTGVSSAITLPECRMYVDGTAQNLTEVTSFVNGRILWNLYNCTASVTTRLMYGSVLAPDASVTVGQNLNGTVIGNNVTISAESHRDDFIGDVQNGVTVTGTKVWTDYGAGAPANTSVTFQLYRSTDGGVTKTAYGTPVTLNSTTGWSYNWLELPTGSLYTIVETTVMRGSTNVTASYNATYSTQTGVASGSITVSNQYLYALPETGGAGETHYYTLGICLVSLAGALMLLYRAGTAQRRAHSQRNRAGSK
jgi:hypothetical protein